MSTIESDGAIDENEANLCQSMPDKSQKSGPWTKHDKEARRNEVYRLHFDYDFSARRISDLMKVNRNTVNRDLRFWYSEILDSSRILEPELIVEVNLERLKIQYARLRESLDKTDSEEIKNKIERLMLDVVSKINYTVQRRAESHVRIKNMVVEDINKWMEENRKDTRYMTLFDKFKLSSNARKKIEKIMEDDAKKGDPDFN
ncbi:hypothetical protein [Nitrosopumilus sp.]|uniref:hypothetical protein n=1 Tax=Nitrosopumilus sp. TaxID=2024843 RepID=UPI0034A08B1B